MFIKLYVSIISCIVDLQAEGSGVFVRLCRPPRTEQGIITSLAEHQTQQVSSTVSFMHSTDNVGETWAE